MEDESLKRSHRIVQNHVLQVSRELNSEYSKMGYEKDKKKIKEGQNYTWRSNSIIRRNQAFELCEEKFSSCT